MKYEIYWYGLCYKYMNLNKYLRNYKNPNYKNHLTWLLRETSNKI